MDWAMDIKPTIYIRTFFDYNNYINVKRRLLMGDIEEL